MSSGVKSPEMIHERSTSELRRGSALSAEVDPTSSSLLWRSALGLPALAFVMLFLLEAGGNMKGSWLGVSPRALIVLGGLLGILAGLLHPSIQAESSGLGGCLSR